MSSTKIVLKDKSGFINLNFSNKISGGFTIIELLVVMAIISLLSSIIITTVSSGRNKAKDGKLRQEMSQFENLAALNYADYGSYCQIQYAWIPYNGSCATAFPNTYNYGAEAQKLCNDIIQNSADDPVLYPVYGNQLKLYNNTTTGCATSYSFMTYLNSGKWYCMGSSGRKGEYTSYSGNPGCYDNP